MGRNKLKVYSYILEMVRPTEGLAALSRRKEGGRKREGERWKGQGVDVGGGEREGEERWGHFSPDRGGEECGGGGGAPGGAVGGKSGR